MAFRRKTFFRQIQFIQVILVLSGISSSLAEPAQEKVFFDYLDEEGNLTGGFVLQAKPYISKAMAPLVAPYVTLLDNGPVANRIDFVVVGDGYTTADLPLFATNVDTAIAGFLAEDPFLTYQTLFNFYRVDVESNESGVDFDPDPSVLKDTAMDMEFFCGGIERLLCVDVDKAYQFAVNAPEVDHVLALANTTKYGGAGYAGSNLATLAGGNSAAIELALHETGHSLGNLADEYLYTNLPYTGPEPLEANISIYDHAAMEIWGGKWTPWLGDSIADQGGYISTYEGATHPSGIYRATLDSKMKTLGQPFNAVSNEGLIMEFYKVVQPIDEATPDTLVLDETTTAFVAPLKPVGHSLDVQWFLNEVPISGATADSLVLADLNLAAGMYSLAVEVIDNTAMVRNEGFRDSSMTEIRTWSVDIGVVSGVNDVPAGDRVVLYDAYPNPFNPMTSLKYDLPRESRVHLAIYDIQGRIVRVLVAGEDQVPGVHDAIWVGNDNAGQTVAAGVYFYKLEAGSYVETKRMTLLK